jgi:hypothetical protein
MLVSRLHEAEALAQQFLEAVANEALKPFVSGIR